MAGGGGLLRDGDGMVMGERFHDGLREDFAETSRRACGNCIEILGAVDVAVIARNAWILQGPREDCNDFLLIT